MRISQQQLVTSSLEHVRVRLDALAKAQSVASTGRTVQKPSDDPGKAGGILGLRAAQKAREQEAKNADNASTWVSLADAKLQQASQAIQRVRDLAVRASSTLQPSEREAIAVEMNGLRDEILGIANSQNEGQGLFAGTVGGAAIAQVAGSWMYVGNQGQVTRRVADNETIAVNQTGDQVFGFTAGDNTFQMIDDIVGLVRSGDATAVGSSITRVDAALQRVLGGAAQVGAVGARIERVTDRNATEQTAIKTELSDLEDADMVDALSELKLQETGYQATLTAMARVLQPSLADFLH
jgi:flagellar hook-associated protein 3 FlgL